MAVRILAYLGLLYQDILRAGRPGAGERLPPVLPIVLYNGKPRWNAPEELADLIAEVPGGLERYRPRLRYPLLDEGRYAASELPAQRNLAAALFRLENSREPQDVQQVLAALVEWLGAPEQSSLRRAFVVWIKRAFLPGRMPGVNFNRLEELREVKSMLAETVIEWTEQWKRQGLSQGLSQGLELGRREGEEALLQRLMERRFGALDRAARDKLRGADAETLLRWADRLLGAASPEDVFKD
jgi:hypothetical protein